MRPILIVIFIFFPNFGNAENKIPIFVIPDNSLSQKQSESEKKYQKSEEVIHDPALNNINQETVQSNSLPGSSASNKSISDLADKITSAQVEHYGGEAGALRIRLRGSRAFEPSFYFNGLPLTGAGNSEQNISLIPTPNIGQLQIYPDSPPFWLNSSGISGDIDILSCRKIYCFSYDSNPNINSYKLTQRVGSYHFLQTTSSYALRIKPQNEIFTTIEYSNSKEDYSVFNNNNSTLNSSNGSYEKIQNNDFKKISGSIGISTFNESLGKIYFDAAIGNQNKGIPGSIGSESNARINRNILLGTLRNEKLFATSGLQWNNQLGILYNTSEIQNFMNSFAAQANQSTNYTLQAKTWFILPTNFFSQEQLGLSVELLNTSQNTNTNVPASNSSEYNSKVEANRIDLRPSIFKSIIFDINSQYSISANAIAWISFSQAHSKIQCNYPSIKNYCTSQFDVQENPIYGYTFSIQNKYNFLIHFIRYSLSMRRPYLSEFYGSPGGVLPNIQLLPENSKKTETGIRTPLGEIGFFHANDSNLIYLNQTSSFSSQYQNIENGNRNGIYLISDYYLLNNWKASFSYQFLNSKMIQDNNETIVPRTAKHVVNAATNLEEVFLGNIFDFQSKFGSYFNMNWQSSFYLDYSNINEINLPPIYNTGVSFYFSNQKKYQTYSISIDCYNIFNETYATLSNSTGFVQQIQSNGYIGYPPPGRRFYLSIIGEF